MRAEANVPRSPGGHATSAAPVAPSCICGGAHNLPIGAPWSTGAMRCTAAPNGGSASVRQDLPVTQRDDADRSSPMSAADSARRDWPGSRH
jgi:hypothetical protein